LISFGPLVAAGGLLVFVSSLDPAFIYKPFNCCLLISGDSGVQDNGWEYTPPLVAFDSFCMDAEARCDILA